MSEPEKAAALDLLRDPHLLDRILTDFDRCGVVGEDDNKVVGYLAATSRKLRQPLAIMIQSSSAAGKSSLMESILDFVPYEDRFSFSAMTPQSIFYMGETDIGHKVLSIAEEAGAERASYALKVLQSEGQLTIASTAKEPGTGRLVSHQYRVQGPVASSPRPRPSTWTRSFSPGASCSPWTSGPNRPGPFTTASGTHRPSTGSSPEGAVSTSSHLTGTPSGSCGPSGW